MSTTTCASAQDNPGVESRRNERRGHVPTARTAAELQRVTPLDRTEAQLLVAEASEGGFDSVAYCALRDHLWSYAVPVIKDALRTGRMPRLLFNHGIVPSITPLDRIALHTSMESRDELTIDLIVAGENHFRTSTIEKGRWDPDQGAAIETFFVTGCLFQFKTVYARWSKQRTDAHALLYDDLPELFAPTDPNADTAETAVNREMVLTVLREADAATRAILVLVANDYSYAEVGLKVGLSARAVEGRIYRFKRAVESTFAGRSVTRAKKSLVA